MKLERILHVVGRMDRAGAETMIMNLYREIDRNKYQFDFVYFTEDCCDFDDEIIAMGGRIIRLKNNYPIQRFWSLFKTLRSGNWTIVQSHMLFSIGLDLLAAKLANVPLRIAHSHNTSDNNSLSMLGRCYQRGMRSLMTWAPTHYVACGNAAAEYLFPDQRDVKIIPNAVDIELFSQKNGGAIRDELEVNDDCLIVLQVGRLMPVKNHVWSLKIAKEISKTTPEFIMIFVGVGPEKSRLKMETNKLELTDNVKFLELREDVAELMAAADVMLMPSLHEGFPVVLVESQAAGLTSVISSTISDEVDLGLDLVKFVKLEQPAKYWAEIIIAAKNRSRVDINTRKLALEKRGFSSKTSAKNLANMYNVS